MSIKRLRPKQKKKKRDKRYERTVVNLYTYMYTSLHMFFEYIKMFLRHMLS